MKTFFYLHTCSTCQRIMKELNLGGVKLKDIKTNKITAEEVDEMANLSGSFEALFSRRAMKYKSLGLASKTLTEVDYRNYILEEYTFLKRPVLIIDNRIVVGNSKQSVIEMQTLLS